MNSGRWWWQHNNDGNDNSDNGNNDGNDDCGGSGGSDNDGDSGQQQRWSPGEAEVQRSANMAAFNNQWGGISKRYVLWELIWTKINRKIKMICVLARKAKKGKSFRRLEGSACVLSMIGIVWCPRFVKMQDACLLICCCFFIWRETSKHMAFFDIQSSCLHFGAKLACHRPGTKYCVDLSFFSEHFGTLPLKSFLLPLAQT